ncbi:GAF domain-containing protein [Halobacteria archaeon AArc-dxtr1]|nr:GAF domain-containing protein [Halobacteria archaeon AArc-dxtr1]
MSNEQTVTASSMEQAEGLDASLRETIEELDCVAGTLHLAADGVLELVAHEGIPEPVLEKIRKIPIGKGMAGLAAERKEPVQVCNLQTDDSGVAESGARDTGMEGSIAAPILGPDGELKGVIGVAKPDSYEFSPAERERLLAAAREIVPRL